MSIYTNLLDEWKPEKTEASVKYAFSKAVNLLGAFTNEMERIDSSYEAQRVALEQKERNQTEALNSKELTATQRIRQDNNEFEHMMKKIESELESFEFQVNHMLSSEQGSRFRTLQSINRHVTLANSIKEAIKKGNSINNDLCQTRLQIVEMDTKGERERDKETAFSAKKELGEKHNSETEACIEKYESMVRHTMGKAMVDSLKNQVSAVRPLATGYRCVEDLIKYIHIGDVKKVVGQKKAKGTLQVFSKGENGIFNMNNGGDLVFTLPYGQTLDEGVSLFLDYDQSNRVKAHEIIKKLVLKTFMSFPPGKVEATMIDPLELGETFSIFSRLGEETDMPRIIDEKIWSQEGDITRVINAFRGKIENLTQSYGDNKEARLSKEPIRVLAITDFPTGFTANALKDLEAIVRKSVASGVCIFIACNSSEIDKLKGNEQSIYNEIRNMLHVGTLTSDGHILMDFGGSANQVLIDVDRISRSEEEIRDVVKTLSGGISTSKGKLEKFSDMFENVEDPNSWNWYREESSKGIQIPIGIKGADNIVKLTMGKQDGSTEHHALITGQTGAGKTNLLHTIIMSAMLSYRYDQVQMYLVDFKEGVEFNTYIKYRLPYFKLIAVDSEREFGLNVLKELVTEFERRTKLFTDKDVADIAAYNDLIDSGIERIPSLILIFDEVQELFNSGNDQSDNIARECISCLKTLVTEGRAAGIHIILASSNFNLATGLDSIFELMAIRIAIKGTPEQSARTILSDDNNITTILKNESAGAAVYNNANGNASANSVFQIAYLSKDDRNRLLEKISEYANKTAELSGYKFEPRVLLTHIEDDIYNPLNQLIINKSVKDTDLTESDEYPLMIGESLSLGKKFKVSLDFEGNGNLLVVSRSEEKAKSMMVLAMASILHGEIQKKDVSKDDGLIYLIDYSDDEESVYKDDVTLTAFAELFESQINRFTPKKLEEGVNAIYDLMTKRREEEGPYEKVFFVFFGINRANKMMNTDIYDEDMNGDELTLIEKYKEIVTKGYKYGICSIVWSDSLNAAKKALGNMLNKNFDKRIVFDANTDALEELVNEIQHDNLKKNTAIYMDTNGIRNKHFRLFEMPKLGWIENYANAYRTAVESEAK